MRMRYVRGLDDPEVLDPAIGGAKAAALAELRTAGFRVPEGYVLTTAVFDHAGGADRGPERFAAGNLPREVHEAVNALGTELGDARWAVRSSAVSEDLAGLSYAGQYESVLDVRGTEELFAAVETCFSSALSDRVAQYENAAGTDGTTGMALLVQRMISPTAAGVAFSMNPVTGDPGQTRINAVPGLGDRMASGTATPEEWVVDTTGATILSGDQGALENASAEMISGVVRRVSEHFDSPRDVEWAIDETGPWIVQARPITGLPEKTAPQEIPSGYWRKAHNKNHPLSPMQASLVVPAMNRTVTNMFDFTLTRGVEFTVIGGWLYSRHLPLTENDSTEQRVGKLVEAVRTDSATTVVERCYDQWLPNIERQLHQLREVDPAKLTDADLVSHLDTVHSARERALDIHFTANGAQMFLLGQLGTYCDELLNWDAHQVLMLLDGVPSKTTEPGEQLAELAGKAVEQPRLREVLTGSDTVDLEQLEREDAEFVDELNDFLLNYGQRTTSFDIDQPTLAERPNLVLSMLADHIDGRAGISGRPDTATEDDPDLEEQLRRRGTADQDRDALMSAVRRARWAYPVRDDTDFFRYSAEALVRYAVLEIGSRISARGVVGRRDDVFLLTRHEAVTALGGVQPERQLVEQRAAWLKRATAHPPFDSYGTPPDTGGGHSPTMHGLPSEVRQAVGGATWAWMAFSPGDSGGLSETTLVGVGASRGRYTGAVRVVTDESEFDRLRSGEVLVCKETTAQWALLFAKVGALVTDTGGLLSHPAIVAREYRVPAVVATGSATGVLRDGQLVTVDGGTGEVHLLTDDDPSGAERSAS
ncbi:pyruvate,water dikinase [Saccharopolyspora lacisalsi]|uniref:Pyruvate,water dikinase n=1 Tax=Halosaccharopolyspora lacisalsi TaxID=1000566 RepID=A0A839E4J5_9PSEU|nr:PEP/pyruvate-binding domain-containing protein [Halosaccharopolyspora lacisalsi]MBA8827516.1 pyruvate,water dikinase [Halosaccharopolyspora lacisalsi]